MVQYRKDDRFLTPNDKQMETLLIKAGWEKVEEIEKPKKSKAKSESTGE